MGAWHSKSNLCWSVATGCSDFTTHNISSKKKYLKIVSQKIFCWQVYQGDVIVFELWQKHKVHKTHFSAIWLTIYLTKTRQKVFLKRHTYFFPKGSTLRGVFSLTHLLWTLEKFWQNQHNTTISFPSLFVFARKQLLQILFFLYEIKKKNIWTRKTRQPFCQW